MLQDHRTGWIYIYGAQCNLVIKKRTIIQKEITLKLSLNEHESMNKTFDWNDLNSHQIQTF